REVRASKNDGVDLITPRRCDHWFNCATNVKSANPLAAKLRLSKFDEFGRAVPDYRAIRCEPLCKIINIGLPNRCLGSKHTDDPAFADRGGWLDRGNRADDRQLQG